MFQHILHVFMVHIHGFSVLLQDLEWLSQEIVRLSKGTDPAQDPKATG